MCPAPGTIYQEDVDRLGEFRKCIECWLCQDVCHVLRQHELVLGQSADSSPAHLTQAGMAGVTGTTREVRARALRELECRGAIMVTYPYATGVFCGRWLASIRRERDLDADVSKVTDDGWVHVENGSTTCSGNATLVQEVTPQSRFAQSLPRYPANPQRSRRHGRMTVSSTAQGGEQAIQANIDLVRRFYDEIFNSGNLAAADEIIAPEFVEHIPQPVPGTHVTTGPEAIRSFASMFRAAIPDLSVSIDDVIAAGDKVVARVTWQGTQKGPLFGADPTGKHMHFTGIDIVRVEGGKFVEHWGQVDVLGALEQLGFLPT
jgi:predicted ester cyclase